MSIVVNNYNYGRYVGEAVESALAQTYQPTEVVVVDDGSTDDSRNVLATYSADVTAVLKENAGQGSAFNAGFSACQGDVVCFLDADDVLSPSAVAECIPLFAEPGTATVCWPLSVIDESSSSSGEVLPSRPLSEGDLRDLVLERGPAAQVTVPTSGNAWSRGFLQRVLPMPEALFRISADSYLHALSPLYGTTRVVNEPLGCYRVHGGNAYCRSLYHKTSMGISNFHDLCRALQEHLEKLGIEARVQRWHLGNPYYQWMQSVRRVLSEIHAIVPSGEAFILLDEGEWGTGDAVIEARWAHPFLERDGMYWGPPADDEEATRAFLRLRDQGAAFLVVAPPAFWWLDAFPGFFDDLRSRFPCLEDSDDLVAFDLRRELEPNGRE